MPTPRNRRPPTERARKRRSTARVEQSVSTVRSKVRIGGDDTPEKEKVTRDLHAFDEDPAYIRVGVGATKNMGPYESLRVDVAITMPCRPDSIEETYKAVSEQVYELLNTELENYLD